MKLTFHGQACFVVEAGTHQLVIDPFLSGNPQAVAKPEELHPQYILLTHGHSDHILDAESIARANNATIVAPNELALYFAKKELFVHPMHIGGAHMFPFGRVKFTQAFHGSSVETEDGLFYAGMPAGILLTIGGKTVYHAGDTGLFGDMKMIGELNEIDLALLPIGDNFTMGPEDAVIAAEWLCAKQVVPIHYNTFPLIAQDPHKFVADLKARGLSGKVLNIGESITL